MITIRQHQKVSSRGKATLRNKVLSLKMQLSLYMIVYMFKCFCPLNDTVHAFSPSPLTALKKVPVQRTFQNNQPSFGMHLLSSRIKYSGGAAQRLAYSAGEENGEENDGVEIPPPPIPSLFGDDDIELTYSAEGLNAMTVLQLRQQLRLRGKKVGGKKSELIDRLLGINSGDDNNVDVEILELGDEEIKKSKARAFAESKGKELIDVTAYLDEEDKGKATRTAGNTNDENSEEFEEDNEESKDSESSPETWGSEAKILEDYDGKSVVVDGLSRTVVEFKGSNGTMVQAYAVASRDSLKAFLAGGDRGKNSTNPESQIREIQLAKEKASKVPLKLEDVQGQDVDDEEGHYTNVVDRDYGDWGSFSLTGAQLSAQEVNGLLFLPDVYGPFTDATKKLADKIAFECQPTVVFVPDVFRGNPWNEDEGTGVNEKGETYEEWRSSHEDQRVNVDIRAAATALRQQYGVSSVSVFGTCYGGGRALEAAARVYPDDNMDDVNGKPGPPHVNPMACVAWYPTRYDPKVLFGENHQGLKDDPTKVAVMAVFAGEDDLPGATPEDAAELKACLEADERVKDIMVKVFPGEKHGFAHLGIVQEPQEEEDRFLKEEFGGAPSNAMDTGAAEVASLLSTAWVETYSRVFLPTTGPKAYDDEVWSQIDMQDLSQRNGRDVRGEIEEAVENHQDIQPDLHNMHPDNFKTPMEDMEGMDEAFTEALKVQPRGLSFDDDVDVFLKKMQEAIDRGDLGDLPGFGEIPLDDSGEAYW